MEGKKVGLRHRRLGARLLPEVPEPPARLHRRLVERRELGGDQQAASVSRRVGQVGRVGQDGRPALPDPPDPPDPDVPVHVILFLFLAHLGVGIVFTLVFVSREAGVKFFRFNAGLAAILIAVALAFRSASDDDAAARRGRRSSRSASPKRRSCSTGRRSAGRSRRSVRRFVGVACVAGAGRARGAGARRRRPAGRCTTAGADGRELPQLGGAARRRLHGDDPRPLVPRHSVAAGDAPAVDRQAAHRVDGRARRRGRRRRCSSRSRRGSPGSARASGTTSLSVDGIFFWQRVLFGLAGRRCCRI